MYSYDQLYTFSHAVFKAIGCSEADATQATSVLLCADFRGVDSHGVARLAGYVRLWEANRVNSKPHLQFTHETPSTAVLDAGAALGLVAGPVAMQKAIDKAKIAGTGWVAVNNSNHFGIAGYHAMMALENDMIGIAMTNASPLVAPTFSLDRLLGTNPIAIAIPAGAQPPFVADFATTTAANGKLEMLQRENKNAPKGWVQDSEGHETVNVNAVKEGGALLPLGGSREHGSHKGYILGATVDIFSAVLSGANYGPWVPPFVSFLPFAANPVGKGIGHFFGAMRIDAFRPANDFKLHMDNWIKTFRDAKHAEGKPNVIIPGDPERILEAERMKNGIALLPAVVEELNKLGEKLGLTGL